MTNRRSCHKLGTNLCDVGYIYIIVVKMDKKKYLKIGKTIDLKSRLKSYNSQLPFDMYAYTHISQKMYNITNVEHNIIVEINSLNGVVPMEGRLEWYRNARKTRGYSLENSIRAIKNIINKYEETYYEE